MRGPLRSGAARDAAALATLHRMTRPGCPFLDAAALNGPPWMPSGGPALGGPPRMLPDHRGADQCVRCLGATGVMVAAGSMRLSRETLSPSSRQMASSLEVIPAGERTLEHTYKYTVYDFLT